MTNESQAILSMWQKNKKRLYHIILYIIFITLIILNVLKYYKSNSFSDNVLSGDYDAIQYKIIPVIDYIFEEGNPSGIKSIFEILGLSNAVVRLPLVEATHGLKRKIATFTKPFIKVTV